MWREAVQGVLVVPQYHWKTGLIFLLFSSNLGAGFHEIELPEIGCWKFNLVWGPGSMAKGICQLGEAFAEVPPLHSFTVAFHCTALVAKSEAPSWELSTELQKHSTHLSQSHVLGSFHGDRQLDLSILTPRHWHGATTGLSFIFCVQGPRHHSGRLSVACQGLSCSGYPVSKQFSPRSQTGRCSHFCSSLTLEPLCCHTQQRIQLEEEE